MLLSPRPSYARVRVCRPKLSLDPSFFRVPHSWGKERVGWIERVALIFIHDGVHSTGSSARGCVMTWRGAWVMEVQ